MNHDPRPHIRRRGHALGRLRSLTAGATVAGVAGVAGFGVLAAATWSGDANASDASNGASTITTTNTGSGTAGQGAARTNPNRVTNPQPAVPTTPRVQRGTGSGHAATGGSH